MAFELCLDQAARRCHTATRAVAAMVLLAIPAFVAAEAAAFPGSWVLLELDSALPEPRLPRPDETERIEAARSRFIPAAEIVVFDFLLNRFDRRYFGCCDFDSNRASIRHNLHSSWVVDRDPFLVNQLGHPYQGSMYHGFARASGLGYWESLGYTFAGSAFWEIAGETTRPSRNDQVSTGIGGSFVGEALFRMAHLALEHESLGAWREIAAAVVSPPVGFNRAAFGDRFRGVFASHDPVYFTRLQLGFSGSAQNSPGVSTARLRRDEALADFLIDYGLPGKPDYTYERPFDLFTFQATASSANGFENAMTRGLLAGRAYAVGERYSGVWGLYGSYDYIAPQTFRVASTALSLGTTGQAWLTRSIALQASLLGGLGYAAVASTFSSVENDFHYGMAPQVLAAVRAIFGQQAALDVTAREYYVSRVAAPERGGHENIVRVDAALTWRVSGPHGLSIKYLGNRRDASHPGIGAVTQRRGTFGIFYTLIGHDRFGAVPSQSLTRE